MLDELAHVGLDEAAEFRDVLARLALRPGAVSVDVVEHEGAVALEELRGDVPDQVEASTVVPRLPALPEIAAERLAHALSLRRLEADTLPVVAAVDEAEDILRERDERVVRAFG
ncbi:hypothetical protein [Sorangium sp. So ce1153]|uniref:hypothetical protein n=1 Tax=Sorangium sp. So ce1153 TaxID=3133333 RepID=UPI003F608F8E